MDIICFANDVEPTPTWRPIFFGANTAKRFTLADIFLYMGEMSGEK